MKKRILSLVLVLVLVLAMTACGGKAISGVKALKIAAEDAGCSTADIADVAHTHVSTAEDGTPCYNIHFSFDGEDYNYMISATGEILSVTNEAGH